MRPFALLLVFAVLLAAPGCQSMAGSEIGLTEKQWLRRTLVADLASDDGAERVWRAGGAFYHFRGGRLVRVSQGTQRHEVTLMAAQ